MRTIKITLVIVLAVLGILFGATAISRRVKGVDQGPTIQCGTELLEVSVEDGEEVLLRGVTASDPQDGDLTGKIRIQGVSKLITDDTAKISYIVFDSHGNFAAVSRMIRYTDYARPDIHVTAPLIYREEEQIKLLDRLEARDSLDGDITNSIRVSALQATSDPDVWTAGVQVTNSMGDTTRLELPIIIHTGLVVRPQVVLTEYLIYLRQGDAFQPENYLDRVETPIGPGQTGDVIISGQADTSAAGTYYIYYRYPYGVTTGLSVLTVVVR